jgi:hypothetical protein
VSPILITLDQQLDNADDPAFGQQLFHVAVAQAKPEGEPHGVADDLVRKAIPLVR